MESPLCEPSEIKELPPSLVWFRDARRSKTKSKLSLEKALVRRFGLGGQFPDSSTKVFAKGTNDPGRSCLFV